MINNNITFVVFTFNEERRIEYVLRCFKDYGKILIVDNYSTDRTVEIAKNYGADVYCRKNTSGFAEEEKEVETILSKVVTNWVYCGCVDELCPKILLDKFVEISKQSKYKIVYAKRKNMHYGLLNLGLEHCCQTRLFKKGSIDFRGNRIHHFGKVVVLPEEILYLPMTDDYSVYHFSTYDIRKFEIAHSKYSDTEAQQNVENETKFSLIKMLLVPIKVFIKYYLVNGGWKSGMYGFVMTMQYCFFRFNVAAKTWEKENNITLETIEQKYDKLKEKLLHSNSKEK